MSIMSRSALWSIRIRTIFVRPSCVATIRAVLPVWATIRDVLPFNYIGKHAKIHYIKRNFKSTQMLWRPWTRELHGTYSITHICTCTSPQQIENNILPPELGCYHKRSDSSLRKYRSKWFSPIRSSIKISEYNTNTSNAFKTLNDRGPCVNLRTRQYLLNQPFKKHAKKVILKFKKQKFRTHIIL